MTEFEVGQVWESLWARGTEPFSTEGAVSVKRRVGMITGIEQVDGEVTKLFFSVPMIEGRKTGEVYAKEFLSHRVALVGEINVYEPGS